MENQKLVAITNQMRSYIDDDGRMVELIRTEDGGFRFEWQRPEGGGSAAMLSTKVYRALRRPSQNKRGNNP